MDTFRTPLYLHMLQQLSLDHHHGDERQILSLLSQVIWTVRGNICVLFDTGQTKTTARHISHISQQ